MRKFGDTVPSLANSLPIKESYLQGILHGKETLILPIAYGLANRYRLRVEDGRYGLKFMKQ
jgi:hypothetical protein